MCHEDPELVGELGGQEHPVYVDPAAFSASVHGEFACIDCHMDLDGVELPHDEELELVDCAMCHDDVAEEHESGPHGKWARDPLSPSAACASCHGVHSVLAVDDPQSPVSSVKVNDLCARCHRSEIRRVSASPHGQQRQNGPAASCADCHTGHAMGAPKTEVEQVEVCGQCHDRQASAHAISLHGRASAAGDTLAPSCITCHGGHEIKRGSDPTSPTATMNIPQLCGTCHHEGTEVTIEHDIPQDRIFENYSQSIHGEGSSEK